MTDIVERLRDHDNEGITHSDRFHLRNDAAAEIEKLRAERDALLSALRRTRSGVEEMHSAFPVAVPLMLKRIDAAIDAAAIGEKQ